jgi:hypothetical protein
MSGAQMSAAQMSEAQMSANRICSINNYEILFLFILI